ncbi:MAG: hypothetical protein A2Y10_19645 [Planctomycetes bacterium GWF2_41_51]|nr:MAG: hypothetical protein A2Y10_19645 [Planctomycetes bacterium GWF2_41_51]HBG28194.1 hypothetical protein [Phycisphaerales bacterium]
MLDVSNLPAILNLTKLSAFLGVSRETCYQWLACEELPPARKVIGKRRYWLRTDIENFLKGKTNEN